MDGLAASLTAKYFPKSGESLVFGNFPVNQLAEIYGTPMFVYDCSVLDLKDDGRVSSSAFSLEYAIRGLQPETLPGFARTLEITYSRRSIKTRAPGNICYRISVAKMGTAASDGL